MREKRLLYVGNALSNKGNTVTTIETLSKLLVQEGYDVYITSTKLSKGSRLIDMIATVYQQRRFTDYVLIDTYSTANFWYAVIVSALCRRYKLHYIPILHGGNLPRRLEKNRTLCKILFGNAYKNVAPSMYLYNAFAKAGFENLIHIPNAIKIDDYHWKKRQIFEPRILWVRSFAEIYNPLDALKVLEHIKELYQDATLTMVGPDKDGSLDTCKEYALKRNLNVKFTGKLTRKEWTSLAVDYDVFLNTSQFDNMPVSVVEAMALGLIVISTNVGGVPYLIKDKLNGLLAPPGDIESLVKKITYAVENQKEAQQMVINARQNVENFDWKVLREKWFKVLS